MDKFRTVLNIANEQFNLGFGLVALLTAGGEQIFSAVVFSCPCNEVNFIYGMVFLLVPALALLILGFILSKKMWKLLTGLCRRRDRVCRSCNRVRYFVNALIQISMVALVAPSTWIAVALLNGKFIECAMTGTNVTLFNNHLCKGQQQEADCLKALPAFPCGKDGAVSKDVREAVLLTIKAESQVVGWLLIASIIVFHLLMTCVARCCSPVSYLQLKFWRRYTQEESSVLETHVASHARELAERNVKSFFNRTSLEKLQTPSSQDWEQISALYKYRTKDQHYSTLHCFVEKSPEKRNNSVKSTDSDSLIPAALGFVDDGRASL